ncbi:MAG TPA: hypothetical protein VJS68_01635 [Thermoplasmata archaeon]|nr:hypothetical protein [Thermoplasmata archaeon]
MSSRSSRSGSQSPELDAIAERIRPIATSHRVERLGGVRVPLTLHHLPWANLFRLPDGRVVVTLRLWNLDRVERRCVPLDLLVTYARRNGLRALTGEIERILEGSRVPHASG